MLKIYNTLTRKKEIFKSIKKNKVNLFVCGFTSYDYPHIGHAKTYVNFDVIVRYLRYKKYNLFYLQNVTDLDDKIINRAQELNTSVKEISRKFEKIYLEDMKSLKINSVNKYARATDHIKEIISQVKRLIEKGYAYEISDGIYFNLKKFKNYGKLSRRNILQAEDAVTRIDESKTKKNKGDFCLWKFSKPNEPTWKTNVKEIKNGRPGWHIEDTAITEKYLGPQYDIHGGAQDLIFPHHEAEIAQMESISGKKPLVRYWMHTGFLNVKGKKMSKSLGNFVTIRDALKRYDAETLRFFFISTHYRSPIDFSERNLVQSKNALQRINDFMNNIKNKKDKVSNKLIQKTNKDFIEAMDNDFDTPKTLAVIFNFIRDANKLGAGKKCYKLMLELDKVLGILKLKEEKISKEIKLLIEKREKARKEKNYKLADKIRAQLREKEVILEDTEKGVEVKFIK